MWILLTEKLPTNPSPPKLSIFWSVPWPKKLPKIRKSGINQLDLEEDFYSEEWSNARKIKYKNSEIRVFPREFNPINTKFLEQMVNQNVYELISGSVAEERLFERILEKNQRPIFEAALIDGCTKAQAKATALGGDITLPDWKFPPIGWFKPAKKYAKFFCYSEEMKE